MIISRPQSGDRFGAIPHRTPQKPLRHKARPKIYPTENNRGDTAFMRIAPTPPLSNHRLARLTAWARLWLVWFVGVCLTHFGADAPQSWRRGARRQLGKAARMVAQLIFLHAAARVGPLPRRAIHRHGRRKQAGGARAIIGAALRRALRGKDLPSRLASILTLMRDSEHHIAKLARRLARGLTRLRVILPARERVPHVAAGPLAALAGADTS